MTKQQAPAGTTMASAKRVIESTWHMISRELDHKQETTRTLKNCLKQTRRERPGIGLQVMGLCAERILIGAKTKPSAASLFGDSNSLQPLTIIGAAFSDKLYPLTGLQLELLQTAITTVREHDLQRINRYELSPASHGY